MCCDVPMARKAETISMTSIAEHHEGCADCAADGRFDRMYVLPSWWSVLLVGLVAEAHGAKPRRGKQRGSKTELVLKAHDAATLHRTHEDFMRLLPMLEKSIHESVFAFCERLPSLITPAPSAKR